MSWDLRLINLSLFLIKSLTKKNLKVWTKKLGFSTKDIELECTSDLR